MNTELNKVLAKASTLGWTYIVDKMPSGIVNGWRQKERNYVKLRKQSPAGEDFSMIIDFTEKNPVDTFLVNLKKYLDSFDVDEHTAQWVSQRGKGSCPNSILDLLTDAEQIRDSIFKLWSALSEGTPFGTLGAELSALLSEIEMLLELAPRKEDCSHSEYQIFSDLARLQKSLINTGIAKERRYFNKSRN